MDFYRFIAILFGKKKVSSASSMETSTSSTTTRTQIPYLEPGLKALTSPSSHRFNRCTCINRANLKPKPKPEPKRSPPAVKKKNKKKREFPPPIPLLARTENLPCHMPWVLKRSYVNGRLLLQEVPVKHHEFFKAQRSEGRLVLRMMYMTDHDKLHPTTTKEEGEDENNGVQDNVEEANEIESDHHPEIPSVENLDQGSERIEVEVEAIMRVLNEATTAYSSSLPEAARKTCVPQDGGNEFFRIGTPTIRPVYS